MFKRRPRGSVVNVLEEFLELGTEHHGSPLRRGFEARHKAPLTLAVTTHIAADSYWDLICPKL